MIIDINEININLIYSLYPIKKSSTKLKSLLNKTALN